MEWLRLVTIFIGLLISLPVFFLGTLIIIIIIIIITSSGNLIRLFKIGLRLFHVKTRTSPPACLQDPRSETDYIPQYPAFRIPITLPKIL